MIIRVCVGSSCYLKGSSDIAELLEKAIEEYNLQDKVTLSGCFCIGRCNGAGVTVCVDDDIHTGITKANFKEFLSEHILKKFNKG